MVTQSVRDARSTYVNISLSRNKTNPRKFWSIINSFFANSEDSVYDGHFTDPLSGLTVPIDTVSIFLDDYFANIGSRLNIVDCSGSTLDDLDELYPEMHGISFSLP